jgi:hypothetical protein
MSGSSLFSSSLLGLLSALVVWAGAGTVIVLAVVRVWRRPAGQLAGGWVGKVAWLAAVWLLVLHLGLLQVPVGAVLALVLVRRGSGVGEAEVGWADEG